MPPETWMESGWCGCGGEHAFDACPNALEPDRVDDPTCWSCGRATGVCLCNDGGTREF